MAEVSVLDVLLHGEPVGTLTHVGQDRVLFAFNERYINDPQRPVLGLGFKDELGNLITDFRTTQTRLLPFFSNLLPEGHMRTYLAERAGVKPQREFFLLWALGQDLPGAITVQAGEGQAWPSDRDEGAPDDEHPGDREDALRFSLAGVQLKFSAINEQRGGLTIPARGVGGDWIIKLPSPQFERVPENEYAMMTLARQVGIDVPPVALVDLDAIRHLPPRIAEFECQALAVRRFDRQEDGTPVHIEDFAQVFGVYPEAKYSRGSARHIARVLAAEGGDADLAEFIRRLTFSTLIGNGDMHLKNWSLIYPDRRQAALAPAYDLVSTVPYIRGETAALKYSRTKSFQRFTEDELSHLAAKAMLPEALVLSTARETVARFHERWHAEKAHLPLTATIVRAIDAHLETLPIA
ncbi:type II toxin-antitoxin system HipA family toxin [Spiribacter halobius]|uniref:Kinase n=1 Tax=Sediminicurvatus halobius TaxID=2182432 RepID=A0A2U2N0X1_9GAMM|nr:type II toxin-antitoxin system HipA family toxin [Spiribacter halobius]PWG62712.1 kinase [Spiribacter halobius]UEX77380.1 type II toxin-antitoxin system HipA family toxin [Spiribacter halobius]